MSDGLRRMKFSIVTPSFRQPDWLRRCVRSVADQGADVEHIIQDAGSGEELEEWVRGNSHARLFTEADSGMYDGLNRGLRRATGEVCAWLNCDEQYLPGTLSAVAEVFAREPETDLVVGDWLITDPRGELLAFRRATRLRPAMIETDHLYDFTCAIFFRRRVLERGLWLRTDLRSAADGEWMCRVLRSGVRVAYLRRYLATFTITGANVSAGAVADAESAQLRAEAPWLVRTCAPVLRAARHVEKWLAGGYRSGPIPYEIYAGEEDRERTRFVCERPTFRHPWAGGGTSNIQSGE